MQMIAPCALELHAGAAVPRPAVTAVPIEQRVTRSKLESRKHSILRTGVLLLGSAVVICITLIWRADTARLRAAQASIAVPTAAVQARIDELGGALPGTLDVQTARGFESYAGYTERFYAMNSGEPAIIAISGGLPLLLRPNGRFVVIYDHGKLHNQWMTSAEYASAVQAQLERMHDFEARLRRRPPELPR